MLTVDFFSFFFFWFSQKQKTNVWRLLIETGGEGTRRLERWRRHQVPMRNSRHFEWLHGPAYHPIRQIVSGSFWVSMQQISIQSNSILWKSIDPPTMNEVTSWWKLSTKCIHYWPAYLSWGDRPSTGVFSDHAIAFYNMNPESLQHRLR